MEGMLEPLLTARLEECCVPKAAVKIMCEMLGKKTSAELRGKAGVAFDDVVFRKSGSVFVLDILREELGVQDEPKLVVRPALLGRRSNESAPRPKEKPSRCPRWRRR